MLDQARGKAFVVQRDEGASLGRAVKPSEPSLPPAAHELLMKLERMNERASAALSRMEGVVERAFGEASPKDPTTRGPQAAGVFGTVNARLGDIDDMIGRMLDACDRLDRIV